MAREHLFRGFHPDKNGITTITLNGKQIKGDWVEGNLFIPDDPSTPTQICMGTSTIRICYDVIPETVGEFINLIDVNKNKIFENDILFSLTFGEVLGVVEYGKGTFDSGIYCYTGFYYKTSCGNVDHTNLYQLEIDKYSRIKVIGNTFENPELLETRQ